MERERLNTVRGIAAAIEKEPQGVFGYVGKCPRKDDNGNVMIVLSDDPSQRIVLTRTSIMTGDGTHCVKLSQKTCGVLKRLFEN